MSLSRSISRLCALLVCLPLILAISSRAATPLPFQQSARVELPGRPGFGGVALTHNMLLIAHGVEGTVELFDVRKHRLAGRIRNMSSPRDIVVDEAAHLAYIANAGAKNIVLLSTEDWQVRSAIPLSAAPEKLLLDSAHHVLYITMPEVHTLAVLDLSQPSAAAHTVVLDDLPSAMALDPSGPFLYVAQLQSRRILVLDSTLAQLAAYPVNASEVTSLVFDPQLKRLYAAARFALLAIDPATGSELGRVAVGPGIATLWLDSSFSTLVGAAEGELFVVPTSPMLGAPGEMPLDVKGSSFVYDGAARLLYLPGGREGRSRLLILRRM